MQDAEYNIQAVRELLVKALSAEELRNICYYREEFRDVYERLAPETGKSAVIDLLLEYAERRVLIKGLLDEVERRNPRGFALFRDRVYVGESEPVEKAGEERAKAEDLLKLARGERIKGNLGRALELCREAESLCPNLPGLGSEILAIEKEMERPYVTLGGTVDDARLVMPAPLVTQRAGPEEKKLRWSTVAIALVLIALLCLAAALGVWAYMDATRTPGPIYQYKYPPTGESYHLPLSPLTQTCFEPEFPICEQS